MRQEKFVWCVVGHLLVKNDVSLTIHKYQPILKCHYCGYSTKQVEKCGACGSSELTMLGIGTQKIEEELIKYLGKEIKNQANGFGIQQERKLLFQNIIDQFEQKKLIFWLELRW